MARCESFDVPILAGITLLKSARQARYMTERIPGVVVPDHLAASSKSGCPFPTLPTPPPLPATTLLTCRSSKPTRLASSACGARQTRDGRVMVDAMRYVE